MFSFDLFTANLQKNYEKYKREKSKGNRNSTKIDLHNYSKVVIYLIY